MYILATALRFSRSNSFDARDRTGMRNYPPEEVVYRGGAKAADGERRYGPASAVRNMIQNGGPRARRWLIAALAFLLTSLVVINSYTTGQFRIARFASVLNATAHENYVRLKPVFKPNVDTGYLVRNKGCRIPDMDPFDPSIRRFVKEEPPIVCEHGTNPPLIESNDTSVFVNPAARDYYYNRTERVGCCWRAFWRANRDDNSVTYDRECHEFDESARVTAEFVRVECTRGGSGSELVYKDYHAFLPRKPATEERCERARSPSDVTDRVSVLIVGLDSVSRLNFHRMMPKTLAALRRLGAVEMLGYNKVADNTYPNLVPVLAGLSQEELQTVCWRSHDEPFDGCPFVWKNFSAAGYRTVFAEDACQMTTFNYLKPGFRDPPTDYYLRPYCVAAERDIGNTHRLNANLCLGARKTFENLLSYAGKAAAAFAAEPYFAFVWQASLTHDFFNYPRLGDEAYRDFVERLARDRLLERTALIVMSDHGMRWGEFRQTYQGRTEDSLPFVFVALPGWWRDRYSTAWANLRRNARRLATGYDLHETLTDLMNAGSLGEAALRRRSKALLAGRAAPRGISWFLPVPTDRTCATAGIPGHWCMCHGSADVPANDTALRASVDFLVGELNGMLGKYPQCATLTLGSVKGAKMWTDTSKGAPWIDHTITVQTGPGDAIFEGTVRYRPDDDSRRLVGSVGRLNAYGEQSACVDEFHMRLYCYCL